MSDDKTEFRLTKIETKLDQLDTKFDLLKTELLQSRCSQPNMCLALKMQMDSTTSNIQKITTQLEKAQTDIEKLNDEKDKIVIWQRVIFWGVGVVGGILVFFREGVISILSKIF